MGEFCWISIIFSQVVKFSLSGERSSRYGKNINMIIRNYVSVSIGMFTTADNCSLTMGHGPQAVNGP